MSYYLFQMKLIAHQIRVIPRKPINRFKVELERDRYYHRLYDQPWRFNI